KKELFDNVIPASNSIMAENLLKLGTILDNPKYKKVSAQMVRQVSELIKREPEYLSNWAVVATLTAQPLAEIIIVGQDYKKFAQELQSRLIPNKIIQGTRAKSDLPLFQYKEPRDGETTIYVCYDKSCKRPVNSVKEALEQLSR
ncbi:MAG: thioredoxin domain-containing protein, partial [Cyclobacteriaceae bacterium]|nr:thioredoxin domain-containing protein [Cyclobacteriaceae bacterium HetDA_MAG_MS6]